MANETDSRSSRYRRATHTDRVDAREDKRIHPFDADAGGVPVSRVLAVFEPDLSSAVVAIVLSPDDASSFFLERASLHVAKNQKPLLSTISSSHSTCSWSGKLPGPV